MQDLAIHDTEPIGSYMEVRDSQELEYPFLVLLEGQAIEIDGRVFQTLFNNSVRRTYKDITKSLDLGRISFQKLVDHAVAAQIPYPLFFAPYDVVQRQLELKKKKLSQGVGKETFSLNSRTRIQLSDVELVVKDLGRKQTLLKELYPDLNENTIVGLCMHAKDKPVDLANLILSRLGATRAEFQSKGNKEKAFEYLIETLEHNQILVSQQTLQTVMPQKINTAFSGITIRDRKVPYIFLAGGEHGEFDEPVGRKIYTLVLMTVLIARGIFAPVTMGGQNLATAPSIEYDITSEILMPAEEFKQKRLRSLDDFQLISDIYKVTPSAAIVWAARLGLISEEHASDLLEILRYNFQSADRSPKCSPKIINAIRKYNGREFSERMLDAHDNGQLTSKDFCRVVGRNTINTQEIDEFRRAIYA